MIAIYKRELKSYFHGFIGFLFIAVTLFFFGLYYTYYNLICGSPYFTNVVGSILFVFLLSIPILTMKVLAEDRKSKTDQLILTAPVTVGQIVIGKFLALTTILAIPTLISCLYPVILMKFGQVPIAISYLGVLDFFLYGMACIAIGIFVSSLTESQVIAAVIGFIFLFIGYMMPSFCTMIATQETWLTKILRIYDMYTPYEKLLGGTMELSAVVYFVTLTVFFLFLTTQSIQKRRYSVSVNSLSFGAYSVVSTVVCLGFLIFVNLLVTKLPMEIQSVDLTQQKLFALTDITKDFLKTLDQDVNIYVLTQEKKQDTMVEQTLDRMADANPHIHISYIDPILNPKFQTKYSSDKLSSNSIIVEGPERYKVIEYYDMYESEMNPQTYTSTITGYDGEGQITGALSYVVSNELKKTYFLTGHGEKLLSEKYTGSLAKQNIEYEECNLMDVDAIPADANCVLINNPIYDFSEDDVEKVTNYLNKGGRVVLVTGYTTTEIGNVRKIANYMNLEILDGIVIENDKSGYYQVPYYLLPSMVNNDYTYGISGKRYIFAPYSQGIAIPEENPRYSYEEILGTSDQSFSKMNIEDATTYEKEDSDPAGPFLIGVEATNLSQNMSQMVIFTCSQIFTDKADEMVSGANSQLFINTMSKMGQQTGSALVSVPVKEYNVTNIMVTNRYIVLLGAVTTLLLPFLNLLAGFVIWFKRRRG